MDFSEFANGLFPYCSGNLKEVQYFNEIIGNFIQDAAMDSCPLLQKKDDTKYRYLKGTRSIPPNDAKYLYIHRDKKKFSKWIADQTDEFDSYNGVVNWLQSKGINTCADDACADLLEQILSDIMLPSSSQKEPAQLSEKDLKKLKNFMDNFNEILKSCIDKDPTIMSLSCDCLTDIEVLCDEWRHSDKNFKDKDLNSIKEDVIDKLDTYHGYWAIRMIPDGEDVIKYVKYLKPFSIEQREKDQKEATEFRKKFAELHEKLCRYAIDNDLEIE